MERQEQWVVIRTYSYRAEADLGRLALEANDIAALVEADDCGGQRPLLGASVGVKLLVRRCDASKATQLLG